MFSKSKKLISMLIIFVILFTYMGGTLEAIATTNGLSAITNGFSDSEEMKFNSYFENNEAQVNVSNVNDKAILFFELCPNNIGSGFLKNGTITAQGENGDIINFKFAKIKNVTIQELEETAEIIKNEENEEQEEIIEETEEQNQEVTENQKEQEIDENVELDNVIDDEVEEDVVEDTTENEENLENIQNIEKEEIEELIEEDNLQNIEDENIEENTNQEEDFTSIIMNTLERQNSVISRANESREEQDEEEYIDEDQIIEMKSEEVETETYEELTAKDFEIELVSDNEISVQNVIYNTIIEVEIEYSQSENLNISNLYKQVNLHLNGTYINVNLEKKQIENNQTVIIGWKYHKDFEITGEYTQVSPFKLGDHTGTIVESTINVKREIKDEKYLPIKQTTIEIDVPSFNGIFPETVSVQSTKLMATRGEDLDSVLFNQDNWSYDKEKNKIRITITNENEGQAQNSSGEDIYTIVYRYDTYTEDEKVVLNNNFKVTVEEFNSNENIITTKEVNENQEVDVKINDLITYNIGTTDVPLNKAKINANYNSDVAIYESEFTTTVNVNILTSDVLEEFKINSSKEVYLDESGTEFDAVQDIYYNKVKFNYSEIKPILENGGMIELQTLSGGLLYTLTDELVQNEESCEVRIASQEKGILVVFKNISVNSNISIEFTKAIGKSTYPKFVFSNFKEIKSFVSAELKYESYDELYGMEEIATTKELKNSTTSAEISLTNSNLSTTSANDNVEIHIALNNDKLESDLYVNPTFELVFPKYVTNVNVRNIDLMFAEGLTIKNYQTYVEDDFVKLRIDLAGTQTEFSQSIITNGTNIVLNVDIELKEYTPKKQDQIKMYYYNEGVTNYESQTKWTINQETPEGIIKATNGFDVAIVNYQSPNGFITVNAISNYDGNASKIKSISEGEKTAQVEVGKDSQISTMELVAMNNTGNKCTDTILIGRIPFEGNTSVISGRKLGTTSNVKMLGGIEEDIQNINMVTIYYSTNENATQSLNDSSNDWTTEVSDLSQVKSYMIVVKGEMVTGTILKFTYDFEIPSDLDYDQAIYGSFGAFYNNNSETVVSYESSEADKIGLVTEENPQKIVKASNEEIEVSFFSNIEDSQKVGKKYSYSIDLINNSEVDLANTTLELNLNDKIKYNYSIVSRREKVVNIFDEGNTIAFSKPSEAKTIQEDKSASYNAISRKVYYELDTFKSGETISILVDVTGILAEENVEVNFVLNSENLNEPIVSDTINTSFYNVNLSIDEKEDIQSQITEGTEVTLKYTVKNTDEKDINELVISGLIPDYLEDAQIIVCGSATGWGDRYADIVGKTYKETIYYLYSGEEVEVEIKGRISSNTEGKTFTNLIEIYTDGVIAAGHSYSYGIQKNNNPIVEEIIDEEYMEEEFFEETEELPQDTYSISGNVFVEVEEENENMLNEVKVPSQVQVQLLKDSSMIKAVTTDSMGNYLFDGLENGDYTVVYNYDSEKYTSENTQETSKTMEIKEGTAVTDTITIAGNSVQNVNKGLQEKENFDLAMKQYISKAIVNINDEEKEYDYNDLNLAKLEIAPSDIDKATVKLVYKLVIENVGNVDGQVTSIIDYVPNGLTFIESENFGWSPGVIEGNIYYNRLKGENIVPGETKEITLILSKKMTEDNTGVVSNKAKIAYTESATRLTEATENNFATQETIVTLTQGANKKTGIIITISMFVIVSLFAYMVQSGRIQISVNLGKGIKKVYK